MSNQASRDYGYVAWEGRGAASPAGASAPATIDTTQVRLATEPELRYWTDELSVTIYCLRDAIAATGTRCATAIRAYLEHRGASPANEE
jgi:hypothetical protein